MAYLSSYEGLKPQLPSFNHFLYESSADPFSYQAQMPRTFAFNISNTSSERSTPGTPPPNAAYTVGVDSQSAFLHKLLKSIPEASSAPFSTGADYTNRQLRWSVTTEVYDYNTELVVDMTLKLWVLDSTAKSHFVPTQTNFSFVRNGSTKALPGENDEITRKF